MKLFIFKTICPIWMTIILTIFVGCGGGTSASNPTSPQGKPIDPSGNWRMTFTDTNNNTFLLSALYNQTGSVVTGINFSEVGNGPGATPPTPFNCAAQRDIAMANGVVANVNQFSGDISGNFGTIHFTSTLNDPGTHAAGTYTLTPGANGNCLGIALTGTFTGDEVPSLSGSWTGTVTCVSNCPTGFTSGTIAASLTQNDATGAVTGSYSIGGVPGISSGQLVADPLNNNFISGSSMQQKLLDNNGSTLFLSGGPVSGLGTTGLGLDRSFNGNISDGNSFDALYVVKMSH
jgi:hypothetical protein